MHSTLLASARPHKRLNQPARLGKVSLDVRMRTPSPVQPYNPPVDNDRTLIDPTNEDNREWTDEALAADEDVYFRWEEEATLLSDLLEATPEVSDAKLITLAESLQGPFGEESRRLKQEIAKTFVPIVNKAKEIFTSIDKTVDLPFGVGLLAVNEACKETEKHFIADLKAIHKARAEHQKCISELLQQLEEEYARREQLWIKFRQSVDDLVNPVLDMLNEAPVQLERTIAAMEKQGKILDKEGANGSAEVTAKALKELLSHLRV